MDNVISNQDQNSTSKNCRNGNLEENLGIVNETGVIKEEYGESKVRSSCFPSSSVSVHSYIEIKSSSHKVAELVTAVKDRRLLERQEKQRKHSARVEKRIAKRRHTRKPVTSRNTRKRIVKRRKSESSYFTWSSTNSECKYCGHRCCRRRYEERRREDFKKRRERKNSKNYYKKTARVESPEKRELKIYQSQCDQIGSRSLMLSALCENTVTTPAKEPASPPVYCEVTPEMIHEAMRSLTMWRQEIATEAILEYVKRNYPVCQNDAALLEELTLKLQVAANVGIVTAGTRGRWRLCGADQRRHLSTNHVSLFWELYADTMKPIPPPPSKREQQASTSNGTQTAVIHDHDYI